MHLDYDAGFLRFVHNGSQDFHFLFGWPRDWSKRYLARELDAHRGHLAYLGTGRFRSVIVQPQAAGRNNARSVNEALVDVIPERDVSVRRTAS